MEILAAAVFTGHAPGTPPLRAAPLPHRTDCCRPIRWRGGVKGRFECTLTRHLSPVPVALRPHRPLMPYWRCITIRRQSGGGSLQLPWSSGTRWSSSNRCSFPRSTAPMQEHQLGRLRLCPATPALMQEDAFVLLRPRPPHPAPAARLAPRARMAEPPRRSLRAARRSGLTSPNRSAPARPDGHPEPPPRARNPGQAAEQASGRTPAPGITSQDSSCTNQAGNEPLQLAGGSRLRCVLWPLGRPAPPAPAEPCRCGTADR